MKTGIVILNYNSWKMTEKLAQKLAGYSCIDVVVVVDNVSTDDSYAQLEKIQSDKIYVYSSGKNGGYSYGNNFGAQKCRELGVELLFIANPDVDIEEAELQKIIAGFENSEYALLSAVEHDINDQISDQPVWTANDYWDDLQSCFFIGRKLKAKRKQPELDTSVDIQEVEILKGSFMGVRMDAFLASGGFDDTFFLFCEERVLAKRIRNGGGRIGIVTSAKYNHNHSASITKTYKKIHAQMELLYRSRALYLKKYEKIGALKHFLYKCATGFSLMEFRAISLLKRT